MSNGKITYGTWRGEDFIVGTGAQIVYAGGGNDYISSSGGSDSLYGGRGDDAIFYDGTAATSNEHTDVIMNGGRGHDYLEIDLTQGFEGNAFLDGGRGGDTVVLNFDANHDWELDTVGGLKVLINTETDQMIAFDNFEFVWMT